MKIILASASERRKELLKRIFNEFEIIESCFDERIVEFNGSVDEYVKKISFGKAEEVKKRFEDLNDTIIISADTVVCVDNNILGKPRDKQEAFEMLKKLSGKKHSVYSGVTVMYGDKVLSESVCTDVFFSNITDKEIMKYIDTGEPMDKAGAYGIQGKGGLFVEKINGCYYNIVGLPINKLKTMIKSLKIFLD
ncbi:Maf-like protein [Clostridium sp. BJN0001]|uniref:Maf-like protein n=1 Tax=Clostridium sp. BJN0001 TaxID=2930219 RepID=UPI001FD39137|nr:Maf-like protein [Clostridium sp. BJN0001]